MESQVTRAGMIYVVKYKKNLIRGTHDAWMPLMPSIPGLFGFKLESVSRLEPVEFE